MLIGIINAYFIRKEVSKTTSFYDKNIFKASFNSLFSFGDDWRSPLGDSKSNLTWVMRRDVIEKTKLLLIEGFPVANQPNGYFISNLIVLFSIKFICYISSAAS